MTSKYNDDAKMHGALAKKLYKPIMQGKKKHDMFYTH
jgi:hypothetical protein